MPQTEVVRGRSGRAALLALGLLLTVAAQATAQPSDSGPAVRIDGLAAIVGGDTPGPDSEVILRSDVELRARIALAGRTSGPLPLGPIPRGLMAATLRELIGEHLLSREARRLAAARASAAEVVRERQRLMRSAGGGARLRELLRAIGGRLAEIDAIAQRRALVAAFLSANLEGATVVTDAEVERAYAAEPERFGELPRELAHAQLRAQLARKALDETIARWVEVLRARIPVRIYAEYQ